MDNWSLCEQCVCPSCEEQDNCAMCGCEEDNQEPHSDCDDWRAKWS